MYLNTYFPLFNIGENTKALRKADSPKSKSQTKD